MKKALILNYHLIDGKAYSFDAFGGIYAVTQSNFELQMRALFDYNIKVASLDKIIDNKVKEDFCIALTFDDGNPSDFDLVFPILKQYGYRATFFLSIQNVENNGVTWDKYRQMVIHGFSIGSHGMTHRDLTLLEPTELKTELELSKQTIENNINTSVRFFSLPFGMYNSKVLKQAQNLGYEAILTTQFNDVNPSKKPFIIDRWSIKRNTSNIDFKRVIQNQHITTLKYKFISGFKKFFLKGFGTSIANKIYTLKNKYF